MPAQVVVVLRDGPLALKIAESLVKAGYDAIAMTDSMAALNALEAARDIELLITSAEFPDHRPNGLALARMTRRRRPELKVIFVNGADMKPHVEEEGIFIATPTSPEAVVAAAEELMKAA